METKTNNQVIIAGKVLYNFKFDHETHGNKLYKTEIEVSRLSGHTDTIPVIISEQLLKDKLLEKIDLSGQFINIQGRFRSYNYHNENTNHLVLYLYANDVEVVLSDESKCENNIYLNGYICKKPTYRTTPLGREITDLLVAVNRPYGKSDYIPCICWGRNASFAENFQVGEHVQLWGRIQSREYQKKISENEVENRVAYEVSVSKLECVEE